MKKWKHKVVHPPYFSRLSCTLSSFNSHWRSGAAPAETEEMKKARVRAELLLLIQHEDAQNQSGNAAASGWVHSQGPTNSQSM